MFASSLTRSTILTVSYRARNTIIRTLNSFHTSHTFHSSTNTSSCIVSPIASPSQSFNSLTFESKSNLCSCRTSRHSTQTNQCYFHSQSSTNEKLTTFAGFTMSKRSMSSSTSYSPPRILRTITEVRSIRNELSQRGETLGFVPTMGALHSGHLALASRSLNDNSRTMVSIFVNPTQFGPSEDFSSYPRTFEDDYSKLHSIGVDYIFVPSVEEMYPSSSSSSSRPTLLTQVSVPSIGDKTAEGRRRPGHFTGVATVVTKLFNIVQPNRAYFGQKDGMQCIVIRRLVIDLNLPIEVCICPTERASDGLALSSRNVYLTQSERSVASVLFRALTCANDAYKVAKVNGHKISVGQLRELTTKVLQSESMGQLEYVSITSMESGEEMKDDQFIISPPKEVSLKAISGAGQPSENTDHHHDIMISIAYKLGKPRLIDNCILGEELKSAGNK